MSPRLAACYPRILTPEERSEYRAFSGHVPDVPCCRRCQFCRLAEIGEETRRPELVCTKAIETTGHPDYTHFSSVCDFFTRVSPRGPNHHPETKEGT